MGQDVGFDTSVADERHRSAVCHIGDLSTDFRGLGTTIDYCRDRLVLSGIELPQTILDTVVGRPLSEIVELPFDCDCRVIEARVREGTIAFDLEVNTSFVDCEGGRIWPEPEGGIWGGNRPMPLAERSQR